MTIEIKADVLRVELLKEGDALDSIKPRQLAIVVDPSTTKGIPNNNDLLVYKQAIFNEANNNNAEHISVFQARNSDTIVKSLEISSMKHGDTQPVSLGVDSLGNVVIYKNPGGSTISAPYKFSSDIGNGAFPENGYWKSNQNDTSIANIIRIAQFDQAGNNNTVMLSRLAPQTDQIAIVDKLDATKFYIFDLLQRGTLVNNYYEFSVKKAAVGTSQMNVNDDNTVNLMFGAVYVPAVETVFGRVGKVEAWAGDYSAEKIGYANTLSGLASRNVQGALDELANNTQSIRTVKSEAEFLKAMLDGVHQIYVDATAYPSGMLEITATEINYTGRASNIDGDTILFKNSTSVTFNYIGPKKGDIDYIGECLGQFYVTAVHFQTLTVKTNCHLYFRYIAGWWLGSLSYETITFEITAVSPDPWYPYKIRYERTEAFYPWIGATLSLWHNTNTLSQDSAVCSNELELRYALENGASNIFLDTPFKIQSSDTQPPIIVAAPNVYITGCELSIFDAAGALTFQSKSGSQNVVLNFRNISLTSDDTSSYYEPYVLTLINCDVNVERIYAEKINVVSETDNWLRYEVNTVDEIQNVQGNFKQAWIWNTNLKTDGIAVVHDEAEFLAALADSVEVIHIADINSGIVVLAETLEIKTDVLWIYGGVMVFPNLTTVTSSITPSNVATIFFMNEVVIIHKDINSEYRFSLKVLWASKTALNIISAPTSEFEKYHDNSSFKNATIENNLWNNTVNTASQLPYDNTTSGLAADNVQTAIDKISASFPEFGVATRKIGTSLQDYLTESVPSVINASTQTNSDTLLFNLYSADIQILGQPLKFSSSELEYTFRTHNDSVDRAYFYPMISVGNTKFSRHPDSVRSHQRIFVTHITGHDWLETRSGTLIIDAGVILYYQTKSPNVTIQAINGGRVIQEYWNTPASSGGGSTQPTYSYSWGNDTEITANEILNPPAGWTVNSMGFAMPIGTYNIVGFDGVVNRFSTYNTTSSVEIEIRRVPADGSMTGPLNGNSGTLVTTFNINEFPNTAGAIRYYFRYSVDLAGIPIPADSMIFAVIKTQSLTSGNGIVLSMRVQKVS